MKRTFPRFKQRSIIKRYQRNAKLASGVDILVCKQNSTGGKVK